MTSPKPIPDQYHTITPYITVKNAKKALEFYQKAFGAEIMQRMDMPTGDRVMHAEMRIGNSTVMVGDEWPEMEDSPVSPERIDNTVTGSLLIYTESTEKTYKRAIDAGCRSLMEPEKQFWGDVFAKVVDPFGQHWQMATRVEDVSPEEMGKRAKAFFSGDQK